jgi:hypothetical protein
MIDSIQLELIQRESNEKARLPIRTKIHNKISKATDILFIQYIGKS